MQIDPSIHTSVDSFKILTSLVDPRPIAWVTTHSSAGLVNLAPFSFFNENLVTKGLLAAMNTH